MNFLFEKKPFIPWKLNNIFIAYGVVCFLTFTWWMARNSDKTDAMRWLEGGTTISVSMTLLFIWIFGGWAVRFCYQFMPRIVDLAFVALIIGAAFVAKGFPENTVYLTAEISVFLIAILVHKFTKDRTGNGTI